MSDLQASEIQRLLDELYRNDSRRVFATLVRMLGDFDLAEEALHEAFAAALKQWGSEGVPDNPRAWLVSTGRFKGIDIIRRRARFQEAVPELTHLLDHPGEGADFDEAAFKDDHLRLIFTCCHPALAPHTQIAMTLREVCGLTTEEIASAFLTTPPTVAQRIVRGKAKIRKAGIPYVVPGLKEWPHRLDAVLRVIYLVFNEGYSATSGDTLTRADLSGEAIRLGRVLLDLMEDPETMGLLALMLLQESRREARATAEGDIILLEHQDRTTWNRELIREGVRLVERAMASRSIGLYTLQAAIAAVHAGATQANQTDWPQIVALYDLLQHAAPSPVVELNRAVAVAMRDGPEAGLRLIDDIFARGELADYPLAHAARADLCRRLGRGEEARIAYAQALARATQTPQRRFLEKRLAELPPN